MTNSTFTRIAHSHVHVVVTDKNDNAPIFVNTPYYGVVPIDTKRNEIVFRVSKFSSISIILKVIYLLLVKILKILFFYRFKQQILMLMRIKM